jgi:arsenite-transporting ATPase
MAQMILFTGKGGVGKSTVSAATALHHAQQGFRTLLVSSDPAHSTDDTLGIRVGFTPTKVGGSELPLWAKNLNAEALAAEFFGEMESLMNKSFGSLPGFDGSMLSDLSNFPGMDEAFALEEINRLCLSTDYDVVVFDTAPTGHTLKALSAPDYLNTFLLKILRMKAKIENLKGFFIKKSDTSRLVDLMEDFIARIERLKSLLRNPDFVCINLVSIPTEAGYAECARTVRFMETMKIPIQHIVINQIIPNFGTDVWDTASQNPAVALLHAEFTIQQPYLGKFRTLSSESSIRIVGMTRLPFEPRAERLSEVSETLWNPKGLRFEVVPSISISESKGKAVLSVPYINDAKWSRDNREYRHSIEGAIADSPVKVPGLPSGEKITRRKSGDRVILSWSVPEDSEDESDD